MQDFSRTAVVHAGEQPWIASPVAGGRRMLDRVGDEIARATSIVRFKGFDASCIRPVF